MKKIILASASPRRKELMQLLNIPFEIKTKNIEEIIDETKLPQEIVEDLAYQKAYAIAKENPNSLVIGCDTIVAVDTKILGKPKDENDAFHILKGLQDRSHKVYTGITMMCLAQNLCYQFHDSTEVTMKAISEEEIKRYIATGEPMDKAGAYGIQGYASVFISKITGDYFNVVGLPVQKLYDALKEINPNLFQ
ncbi:MAG: nucleoside triphosphate pyrophosphatase [Cellulosilyticaceae bacterium]